MLYRSIGKLTLGILLLSSSAWAATSILLATTDNHGIVSNSSTSYMLVSGMSGNAAGNWGTSLTEADVIEGLPPGTLSKLACVVDQQPNPGTWTLTVRVGAADTSLTCTIGTTATRCSDLTHTASVSSDPRVSIGVVPASSPTATLAQLSCRVYFNRT